MVIEGVADAVMKKLLNAEKKEMLETQIEGAVDITCKVANQALHPLVVATEKTPPAAFKWLCCAEDLLTHAKLEMPKPATIFKVLLSAMVSLLLGELYRRVYAPIFTRLQVLVAGLSDEALQLIDGLCGLIPEIGGIIASVITMIVCIVLNFLLPALIQEMSLLLFDLLSSFLKQQVEHIAEKLADRFEKSKLGQQIDEGVEDLNQAVSAAQSKAQDAASKAQEGANLLNDMFKPLLSYICLLYTSPSPRDGLLSRMPSSA